MLKKELAIRNASSLVAYLFIVWGLYRFLFKLPEEIEEVVIKPVLWLLPVWFLVKREKLGLSSVGVSAKNTFKAVYISLFLGAVFAVEGIIINFIKHKGIDFSANIGENVLLFSMLISFATAISEEITFRGYIFTRIWHWGGSELKANLITSFLWSVIHVPIAFFWWELSLNAALAYLLLTTIFGVGSAYVFARTKNIISSVLLHVLWEWPIILFR